MINYLINIYIKYRDGITSNYFHVINPFKINLGQTLDIKCIDDEVKKISSNFNAIGISRDGTALLNYICQNPDISINKVIIEASHSHINHLIQHENIFVSFKYKILNILLCFICMNKKMVIFLMII